MAHKATKPAPSNGTGLGNVISWQAIDGSELKPIPSENQLSRAAIWLARRAPVSLSMAAMLVELHGFGGAA